MSTPVEVDTPWRAYQSPHTHSEAASSQLLNKSLARSGRGFIGCPVGYFIDTASQERTVHLQSQIVGWRDGTDLDDVESPDLVGFRRYESGVYNMSTTPIATSQVRARVQRFLSALTEYDNLRNAVRNEDRERVVREIRVQSRKEVKITLLLCILSVVTTAFTRAQAPSSNRPSAVHEALMLSSVFSLFSATVFRRTLDYV
ncbi:hypothetical protein Hypma_015016 [Hypsizygus marmoreus]|uniref:Uncharacterized protein n=1 Tax=Hypsizygus marmoreus TaxID=39966 RepID=A0A369K7A4_HYPMA|nr:hypothetical protein Hypma_015016 [Hypsizygus marmoreus]